MRLCVQPPQPWIAAMQTTLMHPETGHAAQLPQVQEPRNPGMNLDLDWVMSAQANMSAIERRAKTPARSAVGQERISGCVAVKGDHPD